MWEIRKETGYTMIEMLVSLALTGIIVASVFQFYISLHNQTYTQDEISEMQHNSRACLMEITKTLRMAGFKTGAHPAYQISNDSLYVFCSGTHTIDTVLYYLVPYTQQELTGSYATDVGIEGAAIPNKLMKKVNHDSPDIFSDYILDIDFVQVNSSVIEVIITTQTTKPDEDYIDNFGFRTYQASERVFLRNI